MSSCVILLLSALQPSPDLAIKKNPLYVNNYWLLNILNINISIDGMKLINATEVGCWSFTKDLKSQA